MKPVLVTAGATGIGVNAILPGAVDQYVRSSRRPTMDETIADAAAANSDYPLITPDRWPADFEQAGFKDAVKPLILKRKAMRLRPLDDTQGVTAASAA